MFFVAGVLAVLAGLFYAAGHHELESFGGTMCRYGPAFCDSPILLGSCGCTCCSLGSVGEHAINTASGQCVRSPERDLRLSPSEVGAASEGNCP
jgi:hypothetical protein